MERLKRAAVVFSLIDALSAEGSWCGETHIQKSTYFLQELLGVELGYRFVLYKYGPYSFDFHEDLQSWRAASLLRVEVRNDYGPSILPSQSAEEIQRLYPKTLQEHITRIQVIARKLGPLGVSQLERLATALYLTRTVAASEDVMERAALLTELKPHVKEEAASRAVQEVDSFLKETERLRCT